MLNPHCLLCLVSSGFRGSSVIVSFQPWWSLLYLFLALCVEHINREPSTKFYICYTLGFCEGRWIVDALDCSVDERPPEFGIWGIALSPPAATKKVSNIKWSQPTLSVPSCTAWSSQDSEWMFYLKAPRSRFSAPCLLWILTLMSRWLKRSHLDSIASSNNYLVCGMFWARPATSISWMRMEILMMMTMMRMMVMMVMMMMEGKEGGG